VDVLDGLSQDDPGQLVELIELFAATAPADASNLRSALERAAPASIAMAAHTLKGSAGNFGAAPLCDLCLQIEEAALHDSLEAAGDLITRAERELDRLLEAMQAYRNARLPA
jgi:HPt (histidine-containing phosphotransfer) domain-containing protein